MRTTADHQQVEVRSRDELRGWLARHHEQSESIWLVTWKKGRPEHLPYDELVTEALAWGWVDSLPRALNAGRTMVRLSPRKAGSAWSRPNRDRVARLEAEGGMQPAGRAKVEAARADGSWDRLVAAEEGRVPDDLAAALEGQAQAGWDAFTPATRRRALEWLLAAKGVETRTRRIERIVVAARAGEDPTRWRPRMR